MLVLISIISLFLGNRFEYFQIDTEQLLNSSGKVVLWLDSRRNVPFRSAAAGRVAIKGSINSAIIKLSTTVLRKRSTSIILPCPSYIFHKIWYLSEMLRIRVSYMGYCETKWYSCYVTIINCLWQAISMTVQSRTIRTTYYHTGYNASRISYVDYQQNTATPTTWKWTQIQFAVWTGGTNGVSGLGTALKIGTSVLNQIDVFSSQSNTPWI